MNNQKKPIAKVKPLQDYGLLSVTNYFDDFRNDKETYEIDVVSVELPMGLAEKVEAFIDEEDHPLRFEDVGHLSLLLNYFDKLNLPLFVGEIYDFERDRIGEISNYLEENSQSFVYQMCSFQFQERLESLYRDYGFDVII